MSPIARIALDHVSARLRTEAGQVPAANSGEGRLNAGIGPDGRGAALRAICRRQSGAYFSAHREVMPKARHANAASF
jgi:hypothetical protein